MDESPSSRRPSRTNGLTVPRPARRRDWCQPARRYAACLQLDGRRPRGDRRTRLPGGRFGPLPIPGLDAANLGHHAGAARVRAGVLSFGVQRTSAGSAAALFWIYAA